MVEPPGGWSDPQYATYGPATPRRAPSSSATSTSTSTSTSAPQPQLRFQLPADAAPCCTLTWS
eukprot:6477795-Amphidinium_carterae.3